MDKNLLKLFRLINEELNSLLKEATPPPIPQQATQAPALAKTEGPITPELAQQVLELNKDKLSKKGINVASLKQAGVGSMGVAYDAGDKILKITGDAREAKSSGMVVGKDIPNVIKIFDLWRFPNTKFFGILQEKLTPLSKEEETELTGIIRELGPMNKEEATAGGIAANLMGVGFPALILTAGDSVSGAQKLLAKILAARFHGKPDRQQLMVAVTAKFNKLIKDYKIQDLFTSLKNLGIQYYDFHGGNYGRRSDGTIVLFDLGRSKSSGVEPPELQEAISIKELS